MALTLDANLAAAQDLQERKPLVEIVSGAKLADIPFDGQFMTSETFDEIAPASITLTDGRVALAYGYGPDGTSRYGIKYVYTDTNRTTFTTVTIDLGPWEQVKSVSLCEMTGGNIGLIYLTDDVANHLYRLHRRIVSPTGVAVSNAEIANWSHDAFTGHPWVQTIGTDSYLMVYTKMSGPDYIFVGRTSSDFLTWSAESTMTVGGLTSTWQLSNPSILVDTGGQIWLWFDALEDLGPNGERLTNIYYSTSSNGGASWSSATKVTNYTQYQDVGEHPIAVQKTAGSIDLIYNRIMAVLTMDEDTTGWELNGDGTHYLQWDSANRKLYVISGWSGAGSKTCYGVVKIDVDTWTIDQYWDETTTPGFPSWFTNDYTGSSWPGWVTSSNGHRVVTFNIQGGNDGIDIWVLDGEANTLQHYCLRGSLSHGTTNNVNDPGFASSIIPAWDSMGLADREITGFHLDEANDRLWIGFQGGYLGDKVEAGYIDLTDPGPTYDITLVVQASIGGYELVMGQGCGGMCRFFPEEGLIVMAGCVLLGPNHWHIYLMSDGSLWKNYGYDPSTNPTWPYSTINEDFLIENGKLYAGITYQAGYGQADQRGLLVVTLATDDIRFYRPTYASFDDYGIGKIIRGEAGELLMTVNPGSPNGDYGGIAKFNENTGEWNLYQNSTVPGLHSFAFADLKYDLANHMIMAGQSAYSGGSEGYGKIQMFSTYGYMKQATRSVGTYSGGAWSWAASEPLVQEYKDYEMTATTDPESSSSMFVFWNHENPANGENSIKWDRDNSSKDLTPYLTLGTEVVAKQSIDGKPYTLDFSLAEGHLFDPYNLTSLLSMYLRKGRRITLRWGEDIGGTEYWQAAGTFYVSATKLRFARGVYSNIQVKCEDERAIWWDNHVWATDNYGAVSAEGIMEDLLMDMADYTAGRLDIPTFPNSQALTHQWMETSLGEILEQICNRFGYAPGMTVDDKFTARKIEIDGAIVHTYSDLQTLLEYAPDNSQSEFTNRVTVVGHELSETQTTYNEERVGFLSGTVGWWGYKNDFTVYYSDDQKKMCIEPRLNIIEKASSIGFRLSGSIQEGITYADPNNKYCVVTVSAPNLAPILSLLLLGDLYMAFAEPDWVYVPPTGGFLPTIPIGRLVERVMLIATLMILASTGNFQYEIWAKPIGTQYRKVQSIPPAGDDPEGQTEMGFVVEKKINDELCYSAPDCNEVANFEIMVIKAQRNRVTITKMAHLQDEIADTIRLPHPITGTPVDLYITELTRKFKKGKDGYFHDEIQGWKVN